MAGVIESKPRLTLWRARLLLDQARQAHEDWERFATNYEAAIVFGRSVTFHLQAEYAGEAGFLDWYAERQAALSANEVARFFLSSRNIILKQGPVVLVQIGSFSAQDTGVGTDAAHVEKQGEPGNQVPDIWQEAPKQWAVLQHLEEVPGSAQFSYHHWGSPAAEDEDAAGLLTRYLDALEAIVADAEARWGIAPRRRRR
jgi:hypothetical protein